MAHGALLLKIQYRIQRGFPYIAAPFYKKVSKSGILTMVSRSNLLSKETIVPALQHSLIIAS